MELRALRIVAVVAEQGSVTSAARWLHLSGAVISRTIVSVETELGVALFHRLPRGMTLTDAGETFVQAARRTLHEAEVARRSVDAIRGLVSGRVNVGAAVGLSVALAQVVGEFARHHPHVLVRVLPPDSATGVEHQVRSGACELGFTWVDTVPEDLSTVPVFVDRSVAVVPDGHRLADRDCVSITDLDTEPMIAPLCTTPVRDSFDAMFQRQGAEPHVVAEAATNEMLLELVSVGVGCTVTFESSTASVAGRRTATLPLIDQPPRRVYLLRRAGQTPTPAALAFADLAVQRYAP